MKRHEDWLKDKLQDPGFAAEYLSAAAEDAEPAVYLVALRNVAEARGMAGVAERAGIPRESLYRALSPKGNPRWSTLAAVLRALNLRMHAERAPPRISGCASRMHGARYAYLLTPRRRSIG